MAVDPLEEKEVVSAPVESDPFVAGALKEFRDAKARVKLIGVLAIILSVCSLASSAVVMVSVLPGRGEEVSPLEEEVSPLESTLAAGVQKQDQIRAEVQNVRQELASIKQLLAESQATREWVVIADSGADFSDEQGKNGWYYGWKPDPNGPVVPLTYHKGAEWINGEKRGNGNWVHLGAFGGHGNGPLPEPGFENIPYQPAVRRWISPISGRIKITGELAAKNVICEIYKDGEKIFGRWASEQLGLYEVECNVEVGSKLDFHILPQIEVWGSGTHFPGRIFQLRTQE